MISTASYYAVERPFRRMSFARRATGSIILSAAQATQPSGGQARGRDRSYGCPAVGSEWGSPKRSPSRKGLRLRAGSRCDSYPGSPAGTRIQAQDRRTGHEDAPRRPRHHSSSGRQRSRCACDQFGAACLQPLSSTWQTSRHPARATGWRSSRTSKNALGVTQRRPRSPRSPATHTPACG